MPETTYQDLNDYRLVWIDLNEGDGLPKKGTFLFAEPGDATGPIAKVREQFPSYLVWLEDRECNKIEGI
jgi:hypothetical protein